MIDPDGYRPNVGIVLAREDGRLFWARRIHHDGWQFPQGGMATDETPVEAMYRELREETGLRPEHVTIRAETPGWLRYRLPNKYLRRASKPLCLGQKQVWFLLQLTASEEHLDLEAHGSPEFDAFKWVDYWYPAHNVVHFKRRVYRRALRFFEPHIEPEPTPTSRTGSAG